MEKKNQQTIKHCNPGPMWPENLGLIAFFVLAFMVGGLKAVFGSLFIIIAIFAFVFIVS